MECIFKFHPKVDIIKYLHYDIFISIEHLGNLWDNY